MERKFGEVSSEQVAVLSGGFSFGDVAFQHPTEEQTSVPQALASLDGILRSRSKLLSMQTIPLPTKDEVVAAYAHDIAFLDNCVDDLDECLRQAIRCSVLFQDGVTVDDDKREKLAQSIWESLLKELPPVKKITIEVEER